MHQRRHRPITTEAHRRRLTGARTFASARRMNLARAPALVVEHVPGPMPEQDNVTRRQRERAACLGAAALQREPSASARHDIEEKIAAGRDTKGPRSPQFIAAEDVRPKVHGAQNIGDDIWLYIHLIWTIRHVF